MNDSENDKENVMNVLNTIEIKEDSVKKSVRLAKPNECGKLSPVLVEFTDVATRDLALNNARKLGRTKGFEKVFIGADQTMADAWSKNVELSTTNSRKAQRLSIRSETAKSSSLTECPKRSSESRGVFETKNFSEKHNFYFYSILCFTNFRILLIYLEIFFIKLFRVN